MPDDRIGSDHDATRPDGSIMWASPMCRWGGRQMSEIELREETIAASAESTLKTA